MAEPDLSYLFWSARCAATSGARMRLQLEATSPLEELTTAEVMGCSTRSRGLRHHADGRGDPRGGEPLLRPDLYECLRRTSDDDGIVHERDVLTGSARASSSTRARHDVDQPRRSRSRMTCARHGSFVKTVAGMRTAPRWRSPWWSDVPACAPPTSTACRGGQLVRRRFIGRPTAGG